MYGRPSFYNITYNLIEYSFIYGNILSLTSWLIFLIYDTLLYGILLIIIIIIIIIIIKYLYYTNNIYIIIFILTFILSIYNINTILLYYQLFIITIIFIHSSCKLRIIHQSTLNGVNYF